MPPVTSNDPALPVQKQNFSVYTMMLILSFMAITIGCILLYAELGDYMQEGDSWPPWNTSQATVSPPPPAAPSTPAPAPPAG